MTTVDELDRRAVWLAYGYAGLVAISMGHFLYGIPVQYSDSFGQMLKLSASWPELLAGEFTQKGFMRPVDWGVMKLVFDMSGGDYHGWFRGTHVLLLWLAIALFVALVRPRTIRDAAVLPLGLAVLLGAHTFQGTITEAFPVNHFTEIVVFCLVAALVVLGRYRWLNDWLSVVLFAAAALTLESGLLVWVILVGGFLVGGRGISRPCVGVLVALAAVYFVARFALLDVGAPGLSERSSGFGFAILEPADLADRFGSNPWPFYAYNVLAATLSVLFSEPQTGAFRLTREILAGEADLASWIPLLASIAATVLVGLFVWRRRNEWQTRRLTRDDQVVALFLLVLPANAVISYPYVKDVVMSPAGVFLAASVYIAARGVLASLPLHVTSREYVTAVAAFAIVGMLWAIRAGDAFLGLRAAAHAERTEWAYVESSLADDGVTLQDAEFALLRSLRDSAVFVHPGPPPLDLPFDLLVSE